MVHSLGGILVEFGNYWLGMHCSMLFWISSSPLRHQLLFWWALLYMWLVVLLLQVFQYTFFVLCASCFCISVSFFHFWTFSFMVLLKIWSMPLTWDSSPLSISTIWRFGCHGVPHFLYVLFLLCFVSFYFACLFGLDPLSLSPEIVFSA